MTDWGEFTPGPWRVGVGGRDSGLRAIHPDNVGRIRVYSVELNHENGYWSGVWAAREADARLISKAYLIPRLESALERLTGEMPLDVGSEGHLLICSGDYRKPVSECSLCSRWLDAAALLAELRQP